MIYFGNTSLHLRDASRITTDRYGLDTGNVVFQCRRSDWQDNRPALGAAHPFANWLACEKVTTELQPGFAQFACEYAGVNGSTAPVYELEVGTSQEPIETHKDFVTSIGGKPSVPLNGAIFRDGEGNITKNDSLGMFDRFLLVVGGDRNPLAGVGSYLDPGQVTWTATYCTTSRPTSLAGVGHIGTPEGGAPSLGDGRNWLYVSLSYEKRGLCYKVKKTWRASARGGWRTEIYG